MKGPSQINMKVSTAILHYTSPPVIGGVEAVIYAHTKIFLEHGIDVTVISGRGDANSLPHGTNYIQINELDSNKPEITRINNILESGIVPKDFEGMVQTLTKKLAPVLSEFDNVIVHNIITKHFNLPLSVALIKLIDNGDIQNCIAWCHDFTWTSSHSRNKVHDGYPWDVLRTYNPKITYVTVSKERTVTLSELFGISEDKIHTIYNGVDPKTLLGLSDEGYELIQRLNLLDSDLLILMPVRITQAKNIEYAIRLVHELKTRYSHPILIQTGPPDPHDNHNMEYFQSLKALRRQLDVENEVCFVSSVESSPKDIRVIDLKVIGDFYRVCDLLFMPSHREGFGMPILEAGLAGISIFSSYYVPAALEIGKNAVGLIDILEDPSLLAEKLLNLFVNDPKLLLKRRIRQQLLWEKIFLRDISPLLIK